MQSALHCTTSGCIWITHHHPQRPPLSSQHASCSNCDCIQFKISRLIPPSTICSKRNEANPRHHSDVTLGCQKMAPFSTRCLHKTSTAHLRRGGRRVRGGVRTLRAVSFPLGSFVWVLGGSLSSLAPFAPYAVRGLAVTSHEDLRVMA